jgi:hypothetical protein
MSTMMADLEAHLDRPGTLTFSNLLFQVSGAAKPA